MTTDPFLIAGASAAGLAALSAIRKLDSESPVTLVSAEDLRPYAKPLLPFFVAGRLDLDRLHYRQESFVRDLGATWIAPDRITAVDPEAHTVETEKGRTLRYRRLLIATGATPLLDPTLPPPGGAEVFTFRTLADARAIADAATAGGRAVIVGGGLVGLETAWALITRGLEVHVVERSSRILSRTLDGEASGYLVEHLDEARLHLHVGCEVAKWQNEAGRISSLTLTTGETIALDMLVLAVGIQPAADFLCNTGIRLADGGIFASFSQMTNTTDVFAAGDVAATPCHFWNKPKVTGIWPCAIEQGRVAGTNMAGGEATSWGHLPMNISEVCGQPFASVGQVGVRPGVEAYEVRNRYGLRRFFFLGEQIVGACMVGSCLDVGIVRAMIVMGQHCASAIRKLGARPTTLASVIDLKEAGGLAA